MSCAQCYNPLQLLIAVETLNSHCRPCSRQRILPAAGFTQAREEESGDSGRENVQFDGDLEIMLSGAH